MQIQRTSLSLAVQRLAEKLSVFVAGPFISKDWSPEEIAKQPPAAQLRLAIKRWVEEDWQHNVVFGEHRGVNELGEEHFGEYGNAAIAEMALVADCHAIIVIPASVGSFCEIGAWSTKESYCRKLLVLADQRYQSDESYINLGTFRMAVSHGATVSWCDFEDLDAVRRIVDGFVTRIRGLAMSRAVLRGE